METVKISEWLPLAFERTTSRQPSMVMGEEEGEMLFYALKNLTMAGESVRLVFEWDSAYYSSEFFVTLFEFIVDDEDFPELAAILRDSDMQDDPELVRLCDIAWDRIGLDAEVLA